MAVMDARIYQSTVRYPEQVKARLDRLHLEMAKEIPGLPLSLVLRRVLEVGIAAEEEARGLDPKG